MVPKRIRTGIFGIISGIYFEKQWYASMQILIKCVFTGCRLIPLPTPFFPHFSHFPSYLYFFFFSHNQRWHFNSREKCSRIFLATDVSMSHNDERWHSTELTETGSTAQRPQETGSDQGWAVRVTYGYSWRDLGSPQMMICDGICKSKMKKKYQKEIMSKMKAWNVCWQAAWQTWRDREREELRVSL